MNRMMKQFLLVALVLVAVGVQCTMDKGYSYTSVPNDPLKARIYTLKNGLKVYMTVNKEKPRIQTYIAVRVGGKNDPAETTGLAHYFEHLMFKGTQQFGTQDYAAEKPLLDAIEQQFEIYRKTTDSLERVRIYHVIDSLSYEASKLSIPNEYDKLMASIGAEGTNAFTSLDVTCYTEDIPSNQIENWAKIQADRFENSVIRGFHTELETVYEEKNMSLTRDPRKVYEEMLAALFPHHPYGTQTVLGTQEHLKNPSITNIKNYHKTWYVPNNMAICLSGDFDPDQMIATIDKYFGQMKPNDNLPRLELSKEMEEIKEPVVREVWGLEAEALALAWRFPGAASKEAEMLDVIAQILYNGQAGLIDLDLMQQQKVLNAYCYPMTMSDYSVFMMQGRPKEGQSLDELKALLLGELKKLRDGDFDEKILEANINNFKLYMQQRLEDNEARADMFVESFINGSDWADEVSKLDRISQLTKEDIVAFAQQWLKDTNLAVIYKRQGKDPNERKITKPQITPIVMNRDQTSSFLASIQQSQVAPIEPSFIDFDKDLTQTTLKSNIPVIYKKNETNDLFELMYIFDMGKENDRALNEAFTYLDYLGTDDMTAEEVKSEFYRLACSYQMVCRDRRSYVMLSGLNENMPKAVALFEKLMAHAQVNKEVYANVVKDLLKARANNKTNQGANFSALNIYLRYGAKNSQTTQLSESELKSMNPQQLVDRIHALNSYKHTVTYYGPSSEQELVALLNKEHQVPDQLREVPAPTRFAEQITKEPTIFIAPYDAKQIYMRMYSDRGEKFDPAVESMRKVYNEYFGGSMNSIVFQEMRESRGLAYSANASMVAPGFLDQDYSFNTFIATQNDKMMDAIHAFNDIINNMPESEAAFKLAKEGLIARLRTERILKSDIIWSYIDAKDLNLTADPRIQLYQDVQKVTLQDVIKFQQEQIKNRTYYIGILGDKKELDMDALRKMGKVVELTQKDIFGY